VKLKSCAPAPDVVLVVVEQVEVVVDWEVLDPVVVVDVVGVVEVEVVVVVVEELVVEVVGWAVLDVVEVVVRDEVLVVELLVEPADVSEEDPVLEVEDLLVSFTLDGEIRSTNAPTDATARTTTITRTIARLTALRSVRTMRRTLTFYLWLYPNLLTTPTSMLISRLIGPTTTALAEMNACLGAKG
jgi:hypothetical protein